MTTSAETHTQEAVEQLVEATTALLDALANAYHPDREARYSDVLATLAVHRANARAAVARVRDA